MKQRFLNVLRVMEKQLQRRHTAVGCVYVSLVALSMCVVLFALQGYALWSPDAGRLYRPDMLLLMQGITIFMMALYGSVAAYAWRRTRSPDTYWGLAYFTTTSMLVAVAFTATMYGLLDTPMGMMLLAALALARTWFPARVLMPGVVLATAMLVGAEVLIHRGHLDYAPLLTTPVVTGDTIAPLWMGWLQGIYNLVVLFFSGLMFFMFHIMDRHTQQLENMTRIDALTGLLNRITFMRLLEEECAKQKRTLRPACVMMCDVDHFKKVNDSYGHPAGDLVLVRLGHLLKGITRHPVDVVARYGGEEFVLLLPETALDAAQVVAERLREQLRGQVFDIDGQQFSVTLSIGVAEAHQGNGEAALKVADENLYLAKNGGRDRIVASVAETVTASGVSPSQV